MLNHSHIVVWRVRQYELLLLPRYFGGACTGVEVENVRVLAPRNRTTRQKSCPPVSLAAPLACAPIAPPHANLPTTRWLVVGSEGPEANVAAHEVKSFYLSKPRSPVVAVPVLDYHLSQSALNLEQAKQFCLTTLGIIVLPLPRCAKTKRGIDRYKVIY